MPIFIHVFNVFSAFYRNFAGARVPIFAHRVVKKLQKGFQVLVIFHAIFDYFGAKKRFDFVTFLTTFGGPRPPSGPREPTTRGVKKCVFLLGLRNAKKKHGPAKIVFSPPNENGIGFPKTRTKM